MKELISIRLCDVSGGGTFNYGELAGAVVGGAVTGGLTGAAIGGVGAIPGALGGAALAGAGYTTNQLVQGLFNKGGAWPGGAQSFCEMKGMKHGESGC